MTYLEEWSHVDRDHASSLSGATEALKASTLRLPVVGGARVSASGFPLIVNKFVWPCNSKTSNR